jgi:DNA-binding transcriptional LysR family regulator
VLEVSEIIEIFMVASQSDLCGLIPRSMEKAARDLLGLRALPATPRTPSVPIKLIWRKGRETDPAHRFLRLQIASAAKEIAYKVKRAQPLVAAAYLRAGTHIYAARVQLQPPQPNND